jgi:dienelactone hydrolase
VASRAIGCPALWPALAVVVLTAAGCRVGPPVRPRVVDLRAPDGVVLKGTLFAAPSGGPAVLLLHQCDDQRTVWDPLGPRLAAAGITALSLDFRGYGDSGGTPHDRLSNADQGAAQVQVWPGDVDAAFAFLSSQPGVDASRMGAAGGSCGVSQAIQLARRHTSVKALALLAGPADRINRQFLGTRAAPPVFAAAAADDRYDDFVQIMSWIEGLSPRPESRVAHYPDGGHAAVVFKTHPELVRDLAAWFGAVFDNRAAALPATNGPTMTADVREMLRTIDRPGGAATALAHLAAGGAGVPRVPELVVNRLGYEHIQMKDVGTAIDLMTLNTKWYPDSANTYDSLGDAYLAAGDEAGALAAAHQTLAALDRDAHASDALKKGIRAAAEAKIRDLSAPAASRTSARTWK